MSIRDRMSANELSILFSNLSKGCEKQYRKEESELFEKLSEFYESQEEKPEKSNLAKLDSMIKEDISWFWDAKEIARAQNDRGALRALVWGEKVSKIVGSIISRYIKNGNSILEETNIHVCEICGFVYLGDEPPEVCPVCKVPGFKIAKVRR
ncbi:MAG: rubredoxin [Clostridia bacterium]|nr:rubredoxin [Clostridia bacterium]